MPESRKITEAEGAGDAAGREEAAAEPKPAMRAEDLDERVRAAVHAAGERKAVGTVVLDLREVASFTDFFVIASGTNVRQVQAIADAVQEHLRKDLRVKPARVEGYNSAEWVLLDYGDFIFHVFEEKARRFYDLERLWRDAARVQLPEEDARGGEGSLRTER
ncbi:MAG TPA: ribosome silencing factor [Pyrinomonadaceae bacterium]|jgi:ribosome-associated protein|nr:ribosome silencing factor [Pyrinomonadaceae bacterium]